MARSLGISPSHLVTQHRQTELLDPFTGRGVGETVKANAQSFQADAQGKCGAVQRISAGGGKKYGIVRVVETLAVWAGLRKN